MLSFLRSLLPFTHHHDPRKARSARLLPTLEGLESREVPTVSSIAYNFNGTAINPDSTVWFSSVAKVSGVGSTPATVNVTHQSISFVVNGNTTTVPLPDSHLTLTPGATTANAAFDTSGNAWVINTPSSVSGNVLLGAGAFHAVIGLPGGIKNVTWTADFSTDTAGLKLNWQWSAGVYTQFTDDMNQVGVKPVDSSSLSGYHNSHHAGTPENFTSFVVGGGSGGGGSNFTGSYSSTKTVLPEVLVTPPPPPAALPSLSGHVYFDFDQSQTMDVGESGLGGWTVVLSWTDALGVAHSLSTATVGDGSYKFEGLEAGTYQLSVVQQDFSPFEATGPSVGSLNGQVVGKYTIGSISLGTIAGTDYDFGEWTMV